ncbi:MAG: TraB/GumN family protein [Shewanella sp.]|nr:TraB/GumN family protein [Shewanella sp.]MCF1430298.1 TraB/GumN family protein [Shewanella sp.]MCF1438705.1 TraB/GumN family protein [Shewanella sp.]MCF1459089.1 TraB/GumN family protein [Shewanella sp.]
MAFFRSKRCWLLLPLLLLSLGTWAAPTVRPPFFKLEYQGQTAWLLGSVHVGKADFYPLPDVIDKAFRQSGSLVVEADTGKTDLLPLVRQYGLKQHPLSNSQQQQLADYCAHKQAFCQSIAGLAPWLQASQIAMEQFQALGLAPQAGVDEHFLSRRADKNLYELEGVEQQFAMLASFNSDIQWLMLEEAIEGTPQDAKALIDAWLSGNNVQLAKLMEGDLQQPHQQEFIQKLLWDRNHSMADTVQQLMQDKQIKQPLFIIIGAGHLVGRQSIPALLAEKSVIVTKLL